MNTALKIPVRDALRAAINARRQAAEAVVQADNAALRAKHLQGGADLRVARRNLADVNSRSLRIEALKAQALDDTPPGDAPPAESIEQPHERQRELDEAAAARAAYERLQADAQLRADERRRADARVDAAARSVLVAEGEQIAAEIDELLSRVHPLHDQLAALAQVSAPGPGQAWAQGLLQLTRATVDRITTPLGYRPALPGGRSHADEYVGSWERYLEALHGDAEASR